MILVSLLAWLARSSVRLPIAVLRSVRHFPRRIGSVLLAALGLASVTGLFPALHEVTAALLTLAVLCLVPLTVRWALRSIARR